MSSDEAMRSETRSDPLMVRVATPRWFHAMMKVQSEVMRRAEGFTTPLLCLTGSADPIADPTASEEFVRRAASLDKTLRSYPDLRHELLRETSRQQIFNDIYQWIIKRTPSGVA